MRANLYQRGGFRPAPAKPRQGPGFLVLVTLVALGLLAFVWPFVAPAFAQAVVAEPAGVVTLRPLIDELMGWVVTGVSTGLLLIAIWVARLVKAKFGLDMEKTIKDIEARHREALHSAIYSAVAALRARTGVDSLQLNVGSEDLATIMRNLRDSVPDALAYLGPTPEVVAKIAEAKALEVASKSAPVVVAANASPAR